MESLPTTGFLKYHPNTLSFVRQQYNLDKPGEIDQAIDVLEAWLLKQNHFAMKTFPRDYLERQIILNKGSMERTKKQLDNLFTMKTIVTSFVGKIDVKKDFGIMRESFVDSMLPTMTKDHYRVYAAKILNNDGINAELLHNVISKSWLAFEYIRKVDYCNGFEFVFDSRGINILDLIAAINLTELRQLVGYIMHGYQKRLKGLHFLSSSKAIEMLVSILKQMFSKKIGQRMHIHLTEESLHESVEKKLLPIEFGGTERSLSTLCDEWNDELGKEENIEYFKKMANAIVNESLRLGDKMTQDEIFGITGSFRTINVD